MDDFAIHAGALKRHFPSDLPVLVVGHHARKTGWVRTAFLTFNFSFITRGEGEYRTAERSYPIVAPCMITQWPGLHVEYGPHKAWTELFLMYGHELLPILKKRGLAQDDKPVWNIRNIAPVLRLNNELQECVADINSFGRADELDRIVEGLVLASLIGEQRALMDKNQEQIAAIRTHIDAHYRERFDFDELGLDHGFSPRGFRRYWEKYVGPPPLRYLTEQRVRQARRMLVETQKPISKIAEEVGFDDALYFSRVFTRLVKMSPTGYRTRHRSALSFVNPKPD